MSSSVFFKFKSQREPTRVTFDGTGISVFELKRSIIELNRLGDGTDFDLAIYDEQTNEGMSSPLSLRAFSAQASVGTDKI
jgi:protein MPE1